MHLYLIKTLVRQEHSATSKDLIGPQNKNKEKNNNFKLNWIAVD